jgi:hypothetical protein
MATKETVTELTVAPRWHSDDDESPEGGTRNDVAAF